MSVKSAPVWEEAATCSGCSCNFGFIKRKHHCRNCGKTYCASCSNFNSEIPQFGFIEPVRVCEPCFGLLKVSKHNEPTKARTEARSPKVESTEKPKAEEVHDKPVVVKKVNHCTCNMPLCICPPDKEKVDDKKVVSSSNKAAASADQPKPAFVPLTSSFVGFATQSKPTAYDFSGNLNDQCRDAVKAGDDEGVSALLKAGADPRYMDRTGMTLVHLASMFNRFSTIQVLVQHGADIWIKNPSTQETAVDLAPPALAMKLQALQPKKES